MATNQRGVPRPVVLLVEDSDDVREPLSAALRCAGHVVHACGDADTAFELARRDRPQIVVTDIGLGATSGLDLITRLRSDLPPPVPPIVACSGFPGHAAEAVRRGAVTFLEKPFEIESLFEAIEAATRARPIPPSALDEARRRTSALRRRALALSEAALSRLSPELPDIERRCGWSARWLAAYHGPGTVAVALYRDGHLRVLASSDVRVLAPGAPMEDLLPVALHVLEATSSIVIPDLAEYGIDGTLSARFFAGAPFVVDGVGVGTVCLVRPQPSRLDGEVISLLETLGRRAALVLGAENGPLVPAFWTDRGAISRFGLETLLDLELRRAERTDGSLALVAVSARGDGWARRVEGRLAPRGRAIGSLGLDRHALVLARPADQAPAAHEREVTAALGSLLAGDEVRGIGLVSMEGRVGGIPAAMLLGIAESLCERSVHGGRRSIEEVSMRHTAYRDADAVLAP